MFTTLKRLYNRTSHLPELTKWVLSSNYLFPAVNTTDYYIGGRFTVGPSPLLVYQLGRWNVNNASQTHSLKIVDVSSGNYVSSGSVTIDMQGSPVGRFSYATLQSPVQLSANTQYAIVSKETVGGDYWYDAANPSYQNGTSVNSATGASYGFYGSGPEYWVNIGPPNNLYGPVDMKFTIL